MAVCISHQRQLAIAAMTYTLDNNEWMNPLEDFRYPDGIKVETTFRYLLWDYVGRTPQAPQPTRKSTPLCPPPSN